MEVGLYERETTLAFKYERTITPFRGNARGLRQMGPRGGGVGVGVGVR